MNKKITYLLGAGASYPELPLAVDIPDKDILGLPGSLGQMTACFDSALRDRKFNNVTGKILKELIADFRKLSEESRKFHNVDTLAKYYYHSDKKKLVWLKQTLARYFMLEQFGIDLMSGKADRKTVFRLNKRYLVFLTTILQKRGALPENIRMLTWNYDFQMELAGYVFQKESLQWNGVVEIQDQPLFGYHPGSALNSRQDAGEISLVHLNGVAGMISNSDNEYLNIFLAKDEYEKEEEIVKQVYIFTKQADLLLNFAWEESEFAGKTLEIAKSIIEGTDILVVIGYSFPFFNRNIDKALFETLRKRERLKIYFQDPVLDGSSLRNQFNLDDTVTIKHIPDVNQFYIPYEL